MFRSMSGPEISKRARRRFGQATGRLRGAAAKRRSGGRTQPVSLRVSTGFMSAPAWPGRPPGESRPRARVQARRRGQCAIRITAPLVSTLAPPCSSRQHGRDGCGVDDIVRGTATGEVEPGFRQPLQHRPDGLRAAEAESNRNSPSTARSGRLRRTIAGASRTLLSAAARPCLLITFSAGLLPL